MKDTRPVNLDLTKFKFPLPAIASILHRVSGVFIFLLIPVLLCLWQQSLTNESGFKQVTQLFQGLWMQLLVWAFIVGFIYHLLAGVRHVFHDAGFAETLIGGRVTAWIVLLLSFIFAIWFGGVLWL